jgi:hypothetical protein
MQVCMCSSAPDPSGFLRIRSLDSFPDFTDMGPDPTHLPAIVNKNNFLKHHITEKKCAKKQINATGDQNGKHIRASDFNFSIC